ncbi:MAG: hypothetical protein PHS57_06945 [Alphaproteobacteria bacterium]|nr:hypothetical protein [Alphaproteobacteria bacterium]
MDEPLPPLAQRALGRLKRIAEGNALSLDDLKIFGVREDVVTLKGTMTVSPLCETRTMSYPGGIRGKGRTPVSSMNALQGAVDRHKKDFQESTDWVAATIAEIKAHESQGWGLESAKVTLPKKYAIYAASEICPTCQGRKMVLCTQCQGKGTVLCTQCQGQGREPCYACNGTGEDPQNPGQPCPICRGMRMAPCRFCHAQGFLVCPTCNGNKGTPCPACRGTGLITHEVEVTCGAETHFTISHEGLPSGLRKALDRIGIAHLNKGHADITVKEVARTNDDEPQGEGNIPVLEYEARIPYAEMKMDLGGKKAIVSAVGKRGAMAGVPNFLDHVLKPWRDKLKLAAFGQTPLEEALEVRAIRDALALTVSGKGTDRDMRCLYPFGLSSEVIGSLLNDMNLALKKTTLRTRALMATVCGTLCALFFYGFFFHGHEAQLTQGLPWIEAFGMDMAVLGGALLASWLLLLTATRLALKGRFPYRAYRFQQRVGKTGLSMVLGILVIFILLLLMAPIKPLWLTTLLA